MSRVFKPPRPIWCFARTINYIVLAPKMRETMDLNVLDLIEVVDEGHDIDSNLKSIGSGPFGESIICLQ